MKRLALLLSVAATGCALPVPQTSICGGGKLGMTASGISHKGKVLFRVGVRRTSMRKVKSRHVHSVGHQRSHPGLGVGRGT